MCQLQLSGSSNTAMLFPTAFNFNVVVHSRDDQSYELNSHLINAVTVMSDRKLRVDSNNTLTINYFTPDVLLSF